MSREAVVDAEEQREAVKPRRHEYRASNAPAALQGSVVNPSRVAQWSRVHHLLPFFFLWSLTISTIPGVHAKGPDRLPAVSIGAIAGRLRKCYKIIGGALRVLEAAGGRAQG